MNIKASTGKSSTDFDRTIRQLRQLAVLSLPLLAAPVMLRAQYLGAAPGATSAPVSISAVVPAEVDAVTAKLLQAPPREIVIHRGDLISVRILEIEKYEYKVRVETNGTINIPLVGTITVLGERPDQASAAIAERLKDLGMVNEPHVYTGVDEQSSQVITISGEVQKPDVFTALMVPTLYSAISKAGGLKDTASSTVTLVRPGDPEVYQIPLGASPAHSPAGSIPLYAGDQIVVGKVGVVYVVGAVKLSGAYPLKNSSPMTAVQAIALAGGAGYEADRKDARIVRRNSAGPIVIAVDLRHEGKPKEHDPVLQADDILFIPTDQMKAAIKGGGTGVAVSLAAAALYR